MAEIISNNIDKREKKANLFINVHKYYYYYLNNYQNMNVILSYKILKNKPYVK